MKPVNLNQLLFHPKTSTLSFYHSALDKVADHDAIDDLFNEMNKELQQNQGAELFKMLELQRSHIKKIIKAHPKKAHGFFISHEMQGYMILENSIESYFTSGTSFHLRPVLEELFVNPEYVVVNVSLYDVKVYRGDFQHLEIVQQYEFDEMVTGLGPRFFTPQNLGLVPYKTLLAIKTIAHHVMEKVLYHSLPVIVTGLQDMKEIFLKYFDHQFGVISHLDEDFYEKTCVEILERCKNYRYVVMDYYSAEFKERLKRMVKTKRLISDLSEIIKAAPSGKIIHLILPTEKKLWGKINFETGEYEIHKKLQKRDPSVDILNELAELVIRQGGRIQILGPHFFPQDSFVLAILRG